MIYHNGTWRAEGEAVFTALDRVRLGDGVFDTMLAVEGRLIHPGKHFARLRENAAVLGISFDLEFEAVAFEIMKHNAPLTPPSPPRGEGRRWAINTIITRGESGRGLALPKDAAPSIVMRAAPAPSEFPPIKALIAQSVRRNEGSPLSRIKSLNYGDAILALKEAEEARCNEAILLNNKGFVTCASSSNIFAVLNGEVFTPPLTDGVLNGVARQVFMAAYPVRELSLKPEDLLAAEALILTNSVRGAQAALQLEDKSFAGALPAGIEKDFLLK